MSQNALATAADYSEALTVARRAASVLILLLVLMLLGQLAVFLAVKYGLSPADVHPGTKTQSTIIVSAPTTLPSTAPAVIGSDPVVRQRLFELMRYLCGATVMCALAISIVLSLTLLLITHIMLVGRLIGVGKVTAAYVLCLILIVFLVPWQAFMGATSGTVQVLLPGALYTWDEIAARAHFANDFSDMEAGLTTVLNWARFVGAPVVGMALALMIRLRSNRGLRMAMGEDEILNSVLEGAK